MSSETPSSSDHSTQHRPALVTPALAFVLCCGLWSAACGHKAGPKPPPSKVPQRSTLAAHQRGSEVIVEFPFPATTISGTPLPGISRIEVWRFGMEVPDFAVEMLAEEDAARKEAQALLDELGLELFDVPVAPPIDGGIVDPFAVDTPPPGTVQDPSVGAPMTGDKASGEPAVDAGVESDSAAGSVPPEGEEEPDAEPAEEPGADDVEESADGGADTDDASEADEDGETETGDSEIGAESDEPELTEEEQLALRVETARNLLRSPPTPKSNFIAATTKDFNQGAELVLTVEVDDIGGVVVGDLVVLRVPLPARPEEGPEIGYLFGAKVFALNGKPSDLSNTIALLPEDVPAAPRDVKVEAQQQGVNIDWSADEEPEGGFRIYRRDAQSRAYGKAIAILPGLYNAYLDQQAIYGARYIYGVTAVSSTTPLVESDISSEHEVDYQDRFGPAVPGGLVAFPESGRVRLLWTPVADLDIAGYEIQRRASVEDDPEALTQDLVTRSQYLDETVSTGQIWLYSVVSIDLLDNRSEASAEVQVRVP